MKLAAGVVILLVAGAGIGVVATRTTERAEVAGPGLDERGSVPTESVPSDASEVGIPTAVPLAVTDTQRVAGPPTREETRRPEEPQAVTPPSGTPAPSERAAERQTGRAQPEPAPSEPAPSEAEAPRQAESRAPPPVPRIQVPEITVPTVDTVAGPEPAEEEPSEQPAQPEPPPARLQFVNPVDGLVVTINGERARLEDWTINLPPGTYRIVLSAPGYETRERELTLDPGAIQIMSASLRKQ